ncbi:MAG: hypothetical protein ACQEP0_06540 [Natrinema limicola]
MSIRALEGVDATLLSSRVAPIALTPLIGQGTTPADELTNLRLERAALAG